ncbi:DUF2236 domain-containing protein [Jatrophihabitans telluris]|uniref:DUF2236 domain-containing protein n=1 Tax=Jatrophihabitans telluris TaxID=2038343 RepID=A0ABY4QXS5_9ACTN|nr:oxygenase MpaB family protein [Jatrophihabitans telluris]UQX88345.1 DUF2236 domain-containing protein [Jatrophihabitans telluris]
MTPLSALPVNLVSDARRALATELFTRVAGAEGVERARRVHLSEGERWFSEDRPIRRVHADAAMFVGGLRALLLQSLHPLAMAGVAGHSGFRGDPWGRLARTSHFLAVTTFGTAEDAEAMVARIRGIHRRVNGVTPDGRSYSATDPHLLSWVHLAEVDSFLRAHDRYGAEPLTAAERDGYVADTARVAAALGVVDAPTTVSELDRQLAAFRPELAGTPQARDAARFLLLSPPLPAAARTGYALLSASAVAMMPLWTRWPLRLPYLPVTEATGVRLAGQAAVRTIRWAMGSGPVQSR